MQDVLQCHRFDPNTPIEETMTALHDVVRFFLFFFRFLVFSGS